MPKTAREVFQLHRLTDKEPLLRGVHGTDLFDIEGVGSWFVKVDDGAIKVDNARHEADCTMRCNEEDFVSIVEGRLSLVTAQLQGRVHVSGAPVLAEKFHDLVSAGADRGRFI